MILDYNSLPIKMGALEKEIGGLKHRKKFYSNLINAATKAENFWLAEQAGQTLHELNIVITMLKEREQFYIEKSKNLRFYQPQ